MQCKHCNKQLYVAHICPYCKEYYCIGHRNPSVHACQSWQKPADRYPKPSEEKKLQRIEPSRTSIAGIQKNLFAVAFVLVVSEEILRLISYMRNSPLYEANMYVAIASLWLSPYLASPLIFLTACLVLFAARKITKNQDTGDLQTDMLKKAVPLGIYVIIAVIYFFSIVWWLPYLLR
ncbi:AN1-type zinc finger domain-containing protein [Candidatus Bathyarchaeota archaeon]|nr:AN1-type zinc finger domain-containing protein [Candidatus Bathyarchaeota archaeon]